MIRNCPLTVVLFFFAFGLPEIGINARYYVFGVSALVDLHLRLRLRGHPLGHQLRPRRPGRGGPRHRPDLHPVAGPGHPAAGAAHIGPARWAASSSRCSRTPPSSAPSASAGDLFSVGKSLSSAQGYAAFPVLTGVAIGYLCITIPAGIAPRRASSGRWRSRDEPDSVLYDAPGPRARRRALIGTVIATRR